MSSTIWWTGNTPDSLKDAANLFDLTLQRKQPVWAGKAGGLVP